MRKWKKDLREKLPLPALQQRRGGRKPIYFKNKERNLKI